MGGKASIILVMGMGFLLGYFTLNLNRYATQAVGNMAAYNDVTGSHNLAINGANVGLAKFYQDTTWMGSITQNFNTSSLRGSFTARMIDLGSSRLVLRSISTYASPSAGTLKTCGSLLQPQSAKQFFHVRLDDKFRRKCILDHR